MTIAFGKNGGVEGLVSCDGTAPHVARIKRWHASFTVGIDDTSAYCDNNGGWETFSASGLKGGRGACVGIVDNNGTAPGLVNLGNTAVLTLIVDETASGTTSYSGTAFVQNFKIHSARKSAAVPISFQFIFNGPIAELP